MPIVCGVKFRGTCKVYYFAPGDLTDIQVNDYVIVETSRGREMGQVTMAVQEVEESKVVGQLKPILHRASSSDLLDAQHFQQQEQEAVDKCKEQVARFDLPMKIVGAEYNYDGTRLTLFFTSEQRVDFRELVRELARIFKTRIELRQIGVRDEAKIIGGLGKCGRALCCATWLTDFRPVSIRMAKQQDLPLSPMEISGCCGRLLCCLGYENDYYEDTKGKFPKVGKIVDTPEGPAKIIKVNVFKETIDVLMEDGATFELTADQLAGKVPFDAPESSEALDEEQVHALDAVLPVAAHEEVRTPIPQSPPTAPEGKEGAQSAHHPKNPRSRRRRRHQEPAAEGSVEGPTSERDAASSPSSRHKGRSSRPPRAAGGQPRAEAPEQSAPGSAPTEQGDRPRSHRPRRRHRKPGASEGQAPESGD